MIGMGKVHCGVKGQGEKERQKFDELAGVREANRRFAAHPSQKRQCPPGPMELMKQALEHTAATQRAATPRVLSESQNWDRTQRQALGKSRASTCWPPRVLLPDPPVTLIASKLMDPREHSAKQFEQLTPRSGATVETPRWPTLWAKTSQDVGRYHHPRAQARGISWKPKTNHFTKTFQGAMYRKPQIESELPKSKFYVGPMGPAAWQDPHSHCPE